MTKKDKAVRTLIEGAEQFGIIQILGVTFGKRVSLAVPFSQRSYDMSIDEIDFSARANNSLKRGSVFTVGQIIEIINDEDGLKHIRNLGTKTENEIKTRILAFAYEKLSENEKKIFFYDLIEKNCK